jgi:hypothetical protein
MGRDPTLASTKYDRDEKFVLECQADSGFFSLLVMGHYTEPIPFDSDPGYLQYALQALPNVGRVQITTPQLSSTQHASVCSESGIIQTEIMFLDLHGDRPPILVTRNTANTRKWPNGAEKLSLSSSFDGLPVLRMATMHWLHCAPCLHCFGRIYFGIGDSISSKVNVTSQNATGEIMNALLEMEGLSGAGWTNLAVEVYINDQQFLLNTSNVDNRICRPNNSTTTVIKFLSDYGNIDFLSIIDGSAYSHTRPFSPANISFVTNAGNGTLFECSNQGSCDYGTGVCQCVQDLTLGVYNYQAVSSDGNGNIGVRGDCGYIAVPPKKCIFAETECSGHGVCNNITFTCSCYDGYYGVLCAFKQCPKGPAHFDEPVFNDSAHQPAECSNNGVCNRLSGLCICRTGFTGPSCSIKDCPRSASGIEFVVHL